VNHQGAIPSSSPGSRWLGRISLVLVLGVFVAWIGYSWIGESLIRRIHQGQLHVPFGGRPILNPDKPVDFYLRLGNRAAHDILLYILLGIGAIHLFRDLTLEPGKRPRFLAAFGVFVFAAVYLLNPYERIVSTHGFLHTGIVYQILNGGLPPTNPLLAGEPLLYPWGHHGLVALACSALHITPAWSFALINLISLAACMFLVAAIARRLDPDPDSRVFSVLVGLFASTVMIRPILDSLSTLVGFRIDWRAIPAAQKFINLNGVPPGMVFSLLAVLSLIRLAQDRRPRRYCLFLFLAVAGCGFTYPLMFPAVCGSCGLVAVVLAVRRRVLRRGSAAILARILIPLVLGVAVLVPYLRQITGSAVGPRVQWLQPTWILRNGLIVGVLLWPLLLLIALEWKSMCRRWNPEAALVLAATLVACLGCYLGMHMFHQAEYKSLILVGVCTGVFGGMAFARIRTRLHPLAFVLLIGIFLGSMVQYLAPMAMARSWVRTPVFREEGTTLSFYDPQQDQLYRWIRDDTPSNSVFLDSCLDIPVVGRRSLFIGWVDNADPELLVEGYGITLNDWLGSQSGYNPQMLADRNRIIREVYSPDQPLSPSDLAELRRFDPLYIVIRDPALFSRFAGDDFQTVFTDSSGQIRVVQLRCP
jgi:hypothetical protein